MQFRVGGGVWTLSASLREAGGNLPSFGEEFLVNKRFIRVIRKWARVNGRRSIDGLGAEYSPPPGRNSEASRPRSLGTLDWPKEPVPMPMTYRDSRLLPRLRTI
jgi:hypothetical protein